MTYVTWNAWDDGSEVSRYASEDEARVAIREKVGEDARTLTREYVTVYLGDTDWD